MESTESMDKIKVENDMDFVTDGDSIVIKTDEEDIPSSFSGKKAEPENCMDLLKVEPGSCSEACLTSSHDENRVTDVKVEEGLNAEEDEVDPLLIPFIPVETEYEMQCGEASRAKRACLLSPNQIREISMDLDSNEAEYDASGTEDEEVETRQLSQGSPSSECPSSPDCSASTSEDKDTVGNVPGQQPQPTQWTLPPNPGRHVVHTFTGAPKGKSSEAAHITGESTPLSILLLFFAEIITLLVVETNRYYHQYLDNIDEGLSPQRDVTEAEMFVFLAVTLQMGHTILDRLEDYWSKLEPFYCPFFGQSMFSPEEPGIVHREKRLYYCDVCHQTFAVQLTLNCHPCIHSAQQLHTCDVCNKSFNSKSVLKTHLCIHNAKFPYSCGVCKKSFDCKDVLKRHQHIHSGERLYRCDVCTKSFSNKCNLKTHQLIHSGECPYKCEACNMSFNNKGTLKKHKMIHSGERPFSCDVCNKTFRSKSHMNVHQHIHSAERPYHYAGERSFHCDVCKKSFSRKNILKRHQNIHNGEHPYKCDVCHKSFNNGGTLKKHKLVHSGERPFSCVVCNKSFNNKGNLKTHQQIHTGERPYHCDVCKKSFSSMRVLKTHQRIHSGERPYNCDVCSKAFRIKSNLERHQRVHTGARPYSCYLCSKAFSDKSNLKIHQRVHSGELPFTCYLCNKSFNIKSHLERHQHLHTGEHLNFCDV